MDNGEDGAFAQFDALLALTASTVASQARRDETGLVYDPEWDEATLLALWHAGDGDPVAPAAHRRRHDVRSQGDDRAAAASRLARGPAGGGAVASLADLCLRLLIVSAPLAAKELGVSRQAAITMIDALSSNLRELTERRRYRAWAFI